MFSRKPSLSPKHMHTRTAPPPVEAPTLATPIAELSGPAVTVPATADDAQHCATVGALRRATLPLIPDGGVGEVGLPHREDA